jgi:hypothetical protein
LKNGRHVSVDLEMNWFKAAILPVSCCSCLVVCGDYISKIALTFSGFASIPLCETINSKNFPEETPKAHFARLSFI